MNKKDKLTAILSGIAGQYFVAAELSRRGYTATLTLRNTRGVDILAARADVRRSIGIQVKTRQGSKKLWILKKDAETSAAENLVYVFVSLNGNAGTPSFHVVPSRVVARFCRSHHAKWLAGAPKRGRTRKDSDMRHFIDESSKFLDAWENLGL